ncbi:MAG: ATP-binding protein [Flavobacteriales bacterium]
MSEKGSVFQKGGGGTNFEQLVQTAFLITLIIRGNAPCIASNELSEVALQVTNRGYETDDLLVIAKSGSGKHRLLIQVKHDISFTAENQIFKEVINAFWKDYNNTSIFDRTKDKLIIAKNGLTKDERNHLKSLFNWACNKAAETDFVSEVNRIDGKKKRLDVFREVLKEANNNTALSDRELWEFLKCIDVLEYDFLHEGSVDKTYLLNLIKLSKNKSSTATEQEIWDAVLSYITTLNPNGGSVTLESIRNEEFYKHFDNAQLSPYIKAVKKLKSDSEEILRPIRTSIGRGESEFKLPRTEIRENILEVLSHAKFTIVTGKPGVGKSAQIKEILQRDFPHASVFVFRADQFSESTIASVFSSQGVNETIQDMFSCISLIPEKIIFIDSLEKLLEADPECAFKQLLALLDEYPEIRIIASSRRYAIDLILLKFGIDKNTTKVIEIPELDDAELQLVIGNFPQLHSVLKNDKIKKLLQSPKYLDYSIIAISKTNDDYVNISLPEFKNKLWNSLVVDSTNTKNGLPIKREAAFMEIAVKRAKEMKLFTKPEMSDAEAIVYLENDEIVFQQNDNRKYSPTHDILEDWALVKYVSSKFEDFPNPKDLFSNLGNEPAIRRAFRLWVEDYLIENSGKINELIKATVADKTIEKYWADELLVAVFKSGNSSSFFAVFEKELLADNPVFFSRCLHLIKTCCKETDQKANNNSLLLPIGSGWKEILFFVQKHIAELNTNKILILDFLSDWYYRLLAQYSKIENPELEAAKSIVLTYLKEIESEDEFWEEESIKAKLDDLVGILFELASISKVEIEQLINKAFANKKNRASWRLNSFYKNVIKKSLSGLGNRRLVKELPELVIEIAWNSWKYIPPQEDYLKEITFLGKQPLRDENCWGVENNNSVSPSGIYRTPFYNLLWAHPAIGLKFIIDFINYSVEFYVNATCEYKYEISQIEMEQKDGTLAKKYASLELWTAYRGASRTNDVLESLLMVLEKFLLEFAKLKTSKSKETLKDIFDYVLNKSNNVAPLAVLTSVTIAYPEEVEEAMLPLLSVREFYDWDLNRALQENSALAPMDYDIPFAQRERWASNQLQHRRKYQRGLRDFILTYQFNMGKLNKEIHEIFDKLKILQNDNDIIWKKTLTDIDIRNHRIGDYDEKLGGYRIQPEYDQSVSDFMALNEKDFIAQNTAAAYSMLILNAYEKKEVISFEKWSECQKYYSDPENLDHTYSNPITLAALGLNDFLSEISPMQKNWCVETIIGAVHLVLNDSFNGNYNLNNRVNIMEEEVVVFSSFHLIMGHLTNDEDKDELIAIMIQMLSVLSTHEIGKVTEYLREVFFRRFPNEAKRVWLGLIKYSNYKKANHNPHIYQEKKALRKTQKKERKFIAQISSDKNLKLDLSEINLENCDVNILVKVFIMTPPCNTMDKDFSNFTHHFLPIILEDVAQKENYSNERTESKKIHYKLTSLIQLSLADSLLNSNFDFSKSILTTLVNSLSNPRRILRFDHNGLTNFVGSTLDYLALKLYDNGNLKIDQTQYNLQLINFWNLWEVLFNLIPSGNKHPLIPKLLLDIQFLVFRDINGNPNDHDWDALNGKKEFYKRILLEKGGNNSLSAINVFTTIGGKEFLPDGISWLAEILRSNIVESYSLTEYSAKRMIRQLFYNHISKIKNDKRLIDDYIWILNRMVDLGSSEAYLFRENVITYKSTT